MPYPRFQSATRVNHTDLRRHTPRPGPVSWWLSPLLLVTLIAALTIGLVAGIQPAVARTCRQVVFNPDFEEGTIGWETRSRTGSPIIVPEAAFEGEFGARLGGTNNAEDVLSQTVTFPPDLSAGSLSFFVRLESEDQRSPGLDRFTVRVLDESGGMTLITVTELDNQNTTNGWLRRVNHLNPEQLAAISGQTARLVFQLTSDAAGPTTVSLDEISFQVCLGGPPAIPGLRMSDAGGETSRDAFAPGTEEVFIAFDYANLREQDTVRLIVRDPLGTKLLDRIYPDLLGDGSEEVVLTGNGAVNSLLDAAETAGTSMVDNGQRALDAKERWQFTVYIQQALTAGVLMGNALTELDDFGLDSTAGTHLASAQEHLQSAMNALQAALDPDISFEQARSHVQTMRDQALRATADVIAMEQLVAGRSFAFPPTTDCAFYLTNVYLDGSPAASVKWRVGIPGDPARIHPPYDEGRAGTLWAHPLVLYTQEVTVPGAPHRATLSGRVVDHNCLPVADGTPVSLSLNNPDLGALDLASAITSDGYFSATVTTTDVLGSGILTVRARTGDTNGVVTLFVIGPPATLRLRTAAESLETGQSMPVVVHAVDALGQSVADGTEVSFSVSPPGGGSVSPAAALTTDGYAETTFVAGNAGGKVQITAHAGTASNGINLLIVGPTPTPTWTPIPVPTVTPTPQPTLTPGPTPTPGCDRRDSDQLCNAQVLVRVFEDQRCDRGFTARVDRPLFDIPVSLVYPDGQSILVNTDTNGYAYFSGIRLRGDEQIIVLVEYPEELVRAGLAPCSNSPTYAILGRDDFGQSRSTTVTFRAHHRIVTREGFLRPAEASVCFSARYYLEPTDDGPVVYILSEADLSPYVNRHVRVTGSTWEIQFCNYLQLVSIEVLDG